MTGARMILGFTIVLVGAAVLAGLLCVVLGLAGRKPADVTIVALAVVEVLLIVQIVIAIIAPARRQQPRPATPSSSGCTC